MTNNYNLPDPPADDQDFFGDEEYEEPEFTDAEVEAAMIVPPCAEDDHEWVEAIHPEDYTIRVHYCRECGKVREEDGG